MLSGNMDEARLIEFQIFACVTVVAALDVTPEGLILKESGVFYITLK